MKQIAKRIYIFVFLFCTLLSQAQLQRLSFEQAESRCKEVPKPMVVFLHTSWCKFCKLMENTTLKNAKLIEVLNKDFYFVSFDAESKEEIKFNTRKFNFLPNGKDTGMHQLAIAVGAIESQLIFPTIAILDYNYDLIFQKHSVTTAKELLAVLAKAR